MSKILIIIVVVSVLVIGGYYLFMSNQTEVPVVKNTPAGKSKVVTEYKNITERTISLAQQNGSGESGSAVLTEKDGKVTVTLDLTGAPLDVPQPAHIHSGSCPDVGAVAYPLTNVINGKSVTVLDTTFAKLDAKLPLAVNVHKSTVESKNYVSCGNLGLSAVASPSTASSATPTPTAAPTTSPTATQTPSPTPVASAI